MPDYVPAIKGKMGDWVYYVTAMKLAKIARETRLAAEIHKSSDLNSLIQREIGKRVEEEMVPYLLTQPQRFYGAIIVAVYGGEPEFNPVKVAEHQLLDDDEKSTYGFGLLRFDGSQQYFALDGQHRLRSIQIALESNPDLGKEEVVVIIVKHENTPEGLSRTRRLFSTLNSHAKPTKMGLNIAIDEDDAVAIISRRLVYEHKYWGALGLVKADLVQKQLPPGDKNAAYLTTLHALYECNFILLESFKGGLDIETANRPAADVLDEYYEFIASIWNDIFDSASDLQPIVKKLLKPGSLRSADPQRPGGSALARPLGQMVVAEVISAALRQKQPQVEFIRRLMTEVSYDLNSPPWAKVIWNPETQKILSGKANRELVKHLLLDQLELKSSMSRRELLREYRATTQDKKVKLLRAAKVGDPEDSDGES
ncbi:MAG: DGQHR domain-containing protein [Myxococcales bacterium]|nr:DGQHR domain-containing protein [Myxococcales bacterium]